MDSVNIPYVEWCPNVDSIFEFLILWRKLMNVPIGGSLKAFSRNKTVKSVTSISSEDNKSLHRMPQRISLSNFSLGNPITSYGCILRKMENGSPSYLISKRKESPSYLDIIRGTYKNSQLYFILQDLSKEERERLSQSEYKDLWMDIHTGDQYVLDLNSAGYIFGHSKFVLLKTVLEQLFKFVPIPDPNEGLLWIFPKGKLSWNDSVQESPLECAIREFEEETNGLKLETDNLIVTHPVVERYLGSNSKSYQTEWYAFQCDNMDITQFPTIETPLRSVSTGEMGELKWVTLEDLPKFLKKERMTLINWIELTVKQQEKKVN